MKRSAFVLSLLSLALVACQIAGVGEKKEEGPIKVGFIGPLTGDIAALGSDVLNAVKMRVAEVNAAGGIDGRQVELIAEDGRCNGADANAAAQKLVNIDKVAAIVGGQCSGETLAAAPITEGMQILLVSPVSSSPDVTNAGDFVFRTYPSDDLKGKAFAEVFTKRNLKRVAIISENTDFCQGIVASVTKYLPEGVSIVFSEFVDPSTKDFRSVLTRLKNTEFDVFIVNSQSDPTGAALLTQLRELGFLEVALGTDTTDSKTMFELAEGALENFYVVSVPPFDAEDPFAKEFTEQYGEAQFGIGYAAHAYDAASVIMEALIKNGTSGMKMQKYLLSLENFDGQAGNFHFDDHGDAVGFPFSLKGFEGGEIVEVESIAVD